MEMGPNHNRFCGRFTVDRKKALINLDCSRSIDEDNSIPTSEN